MSEVCTKQCLYCMDHPSIANYRLLHCRVQQWRKSCDCGRCYTICSDRDCSCICFLLIRFSGTLSQQNSDMRSSTLCAGFPWVLQYKQMEILLRLLMRRNICSYFKIFGMRIMYSLPA